jgi:hypothetical protein
MLANEQPRKPEILANARHCAVLAEQAAKRGDERAAWSWSLIKGFSRE